MSEHPMAKARVTVGTIRQLDDSANKIVTYYVAKLGGKIVAREGREWRFNTKDEARAFGYTTREWLATEQPKVPA